MKQKPSNLAASWTRGCAFYLQSNAQRRAPLSSSVKHMSTTSAPSSVATRAWRWLFITLETVVAVTFLSAVLADSVWGLRWEPQSQFLSALLGVLLMGAWLFLLIVSPFFLRSLRGVALAGWLIAFGLLVFSAFTPAL